MQHPFVNSQRADTAWYRQPAALPDEAAAQEARVRQEQLTKPRGALGRLETLAIRLAALQSNPRPTLTHVWISVFAADHGIAADGVSAFPQAVTAQMVANMARGGAAISVLARALDAELELVALGTVAPLVPLPGIRHEPIAPSTAHFAHTAAMTPAQRDQALASGRAAAERAGAAGTRLFIGGEMGIGNTTAAAALACALLDCPADELVGPGTGVVGAALEHKRTLVARALDRHRAALDDPAAVLACVGGFEIAALVGAYVACAQHGITMLIDGFIATAAALIAARLCPGAEQWMLLAHRSAEPGHRMLTAALGLEPILDLGLRLGEGSGAATAVPILRLACALHNEMATFAEAGVADG